MKKDSDTDSRVVIAGGGGERGLGAGGEGIGGKNCNGIQ